MAYDKKTYGRTTSCFLSCFGTSEEHQGPMIGKPPDSHDVNKKKKPKWSLSLSRVWIKKSGAKTVPLDSNTTIVTIVDVESEKAEARRRYDETRSKSRVRRSKSVEKHSSLKKRVKESEVVVTPDQEKSCKIRNEVSYQQDNPQDQSRLDHPEPEPNDSCELQRGLSFCKKIESTRARAVASSRPGSPPIPTTRPISRSTSFISLAAPPKKPQQPGGTSGKTLDPLVGMTIVLMTLIIMVLWGRICAILCTCAWFYFIPLMRSMSQANLDAASDPKLPTESDVSSDEYKKKVVLEGLLERNHRALLRENEAS